MTQASIILVDDDEVFVTVLAAALTRRNYKVAVAGNLQKVSALVAEACFDYAVVDLKIDKESGLDCLTLLKQHNPEIRALILTGYSSIATAVSAIKAGAIDYACKPLDVEEILGILTGSQYKADSIEAHPVSVERLQWEHIQRVLEANAGNISATARSLGMHRRTLQRKLLKRPVKR